MDPFDETWPETASGGEVWVTGVPGLPRKGDDLKMGTCPNSIIMRWHVKERRLIIILWVKELKSVWEEWEHFFDLELERQTDTLFLKHKLGILEKSQLF